ncbi:MAG: MmcQ/YjbR family DNA-binding protein [Candidatus Sulfotelmatobacter sp.]
MTVDAIREFCLAFPAATENLQWGDELCFKIGGKIFLMLGLDNPRLCFKCTPDGFAELIEREGIRPAPYVGRYKWVMLDRIDAVRWDELQELIRVSYAMVAATAPKGKRPPNSRRSASQKKKKSAGSARRRRKT